MRSLLADYRSRVVPTAIAGIALALVVALAAPVAAPAAPLAAINIILLYESELTQTPMLGVTARLADDVPLPAEIVLPTPEDPTIEWSGEYFLGEGQREDILVPARRETRSGIPAVVFVLTQARLGHAEMTYPGSISLVNASTGAYEIGFDVTLPTDTGPVYAAIALPPTVKPVAGSDVFQMSEEDDGLTYYFIEQASGSAGERFALSITVQEVAPPGLHDEAEPWMVVLVAATILGAFAWLILSRRNRARDDIAP